MKNNIIKEAEEFLKEETTNQSFIRMSTAINNVNNIIAKYKEIRKKW